MSGVTKGLIKAVLGKEDYQKRFELIVPKVEGDMVKYRYDKTSQDYISINIYELMHKCKVWADEKYCHVIYSGRDMLGGKAYLILSKTTHIKVFGDSEPEAVFKLCKDIIKMKKDKKEQK